MSPPATCTHTPPTLVPLHDLPDLWVDALLADAHDRLLFLSLWGRDTAVQAFRARLSLPARDGGLDALIVADAERRRLDLGDTARLSADSGRAPPHLLFRGLVHLWVYDRLVLTPDPAERRALLLFRPPDVATAEARATLQARLWRLVTETCHLPLLPAWRAGLLAAFEAAGWIETWSGLGLSAYHVDLGSDAVEALVSQLLRERQLPAVD